MTGVRIIAPLQRAFDHSVTGSVCRRLFEGSVLAGAVSRTVRWLFETRRRIGVGFADPYSPADRAVAATRLAVLFERSAIVRTIERYAKAIVEGGRQSLAARAFLGPLQVEDHAIAVRTVGVMLLWAVAAHVSIFAFFGVALTVRGWSARLVVIAVGIALIVRPAAFSRGWSNSAARRTLQKAIGARDGARDGAASDTVRD